MGIIDGIVETVEKTYDRIANQFDGASDVAKDGADATGDLIDGVTGSTDENINSGVEEGAEFIKDGSDLTIDTALSGLDFAGSGLQEFFQNAHTFAQRVADTGDLVTISELDFELVVPDAVRFVFIILEWVLGIILGAVNLTLLGADVVMGLLNFLATLTPIQWISFLIGMILVVITIIEFISSGFTIVMEFAEVNNYITLLFGGLLISTTLDAVLGFTTMTIVGLTFIFLSMYTLKDDRLDFSGIGIIMTWLGATMTMYTSGFTPIPGLEGFVDAFISGIGFVIVASWLMEFILTRNSKIFNSKNKSPA